LLYQNNPSRVKITQIKKSKKKERFGSKIINIDHFFRFLTKIGAKLEKMTKGAF